MTKRKKRTRQGDAGGEQRQAKTGSKSAVDLLRAIVEAADKKQGGDTPMQEIPKSLICDVRVFLREHDTNMRIASRALAGG